MPKIILSRAEKAEICATMVVKAAYDFNYLGVGIDDIGTPPPTVVPKTCRGHGIADFCVICNFNSCRFCGSFRVNQPAFWNGECDSDHSGMKTHAKHNGRVREIVNTAVLPGPYVAKVKKEKPAEAKAAVIRVGAAKPKTIRVDAAKTAKKAKAAIHLNRAMTVGATSAKIVRNKQGGWTLKLSVQLDDA